MIDFSHLFKERAKPTGIEDVLSKILEGYEAPYKMKNIREDSKQKELLNALQSENIQKERTNNRFLPRQREQEELERSNDLDYQVPGLEADLLSKTLSNTGKGYENTIKRHEAEASPEYYKSRVDLQKAQQQEALAKSLGGGKESTLDKEISKQSAKQYGESVSKASNAQQSLAIFDAMDDIIKNNENSFKNSVGPLDSISGKFVGLPETRKVRGELQYYLNTLQANAAQLEKGSTSDKERVFIKDMFPSLNDYESTFQAKLGAARSIVQKLQQRHRLIAQYIRENIPADEALQRSISAVPILPASSNSSSNKINREDPLGRFSK